MLTPLAVQSSSTQYNCVYLYIKSEDEINVIFIINVTEWQTAVKGVKFDHNLDEVPLEIKSNTAKGTPGKYVWIQGTIGLPISIGGLDVFSLAIVITDNSAWVGFCNVAGEAFFNPEPATTEVVWTVFKTSKEMVSAYTFYFITSITFFYNTDYSMSNILWRRLARTSWFKLGLLAGAPAGFRLSSSK